MSTLPTQPPHEPPPVIGRYRLVKLLGRGGMGAVYLATDTQLDRPVAIKIPQFDAQDGAEVLARFTREAKSAATLHHPNICPVHDVGECDGVPFLVMAYIEGKPLCEVAAAEPLSPRQSVLLVHKLALALHEAHVYGVVHRDLKPANVMIDRRGEPVIMDFGLARRLSGGDTRLTQQGSLMGTPAYMAPEQCRGDLEAMGPPCDIYGLGVILYELLAGRLPFTGDAMSLLSQVLMDPPPPPSTFRPGLDPALEAVCLKALAKKPADRYGSMAEFAEALLAYLRSSAPATEPVPAPPADTQLTVNRATAVGGPASPTQVPAPPSTQTAPGGKTRRRRRKGGRKRRVPLWALLGCGAGAAAIVGVLGYLLYRATDYGTIQIALSDPAAQVEIEVDGEAGHHEGDVLRLRAHEHHLTVAGKDYETLHLPFPVHRGDNPPLQVELLPRPGAADGSGDGPRLLYSSNHSGHFEILVTGPGGGPGKSLTDHAADDTDPAWAPDGKQIAYDSDRGGSRQVYVMEADGKGVRQLTSGKANNYAPAWSPDGKRIAFQSNRDGSSHLYVMDADGTNQTNLAKGEGEDFDPAWAPDGRIVFSSTRGRKDRGRALYIMDADGTNARLLPNTDSSRAPAWSPDGKRIACARVISGDNAELIVLDADGGNARPLTHLGGFNTLPAWSADGKQITFWHGAFANLSGGLYVVDAAGNDEAKEWLAGVGTTAGGRPSWKPGPPAARLAAAGLPQLLMPCNRTGNEDIFLMNADGSGAVNLTDNPAPDSYPAWSPDGKQIAFQSNRDGSMHLYVMDADGGNVRPLTGGRSDDRKPAWSPDGKRIAFTSRRDGNEEIYVMNADGSVPANLTNNPAQDSDPAWSPDGKQIAFASNRGGSGYRLHVMDADGKNVREISHADSKVNGLSPAWSPDGKRIAYVEPAGDDREVFVIDANGANKKQLTRLGGGVDFPTWLPDGRQIAFLHGFHTLYVMDVDGSNRREVLKVDFGQRPAWKPR